jgi:PKD repeat protein
MRINESHNQRVTMLLNRLQRRWRPCCLTVLSGVFAFGLGGCGTPGGSGAGRAPSDSDPAPAAPDAGQVGSVVENEGAQRHIVAQPRGADDPREWVFNVLGAPSDERATHTFYWDFGDGASAEGDIVNHAYATAGTYVASVEVLDEAGASAYTLTEFVSVEVEATADAAPLAVRFDGELDSAGVPALLHATARASPLEADETATFTWAFADGTTAESAEITHPLNRPGPYRVEVAARTSLGRTATYFKYFTTPEGSADVDAGDGASGPASDLTADAGPDQTTHADQTVVLDGSTSTVPAGQTAAYRWTQVSGPSVTLTAGSPVRASFVAPEPDDASLVLVFELRVTVGAVYAVDRVTVTVATSSTPADTEF